MADKKRVRCHGCGLEFDTEGETIFVSCPTCGLNLKVNKRWEPEGAQYLEGTVPVQGPIPTGE